MTPPLESFDARVLLSHVAWVRALARDLVPRDAHTAEDLAQDACLAALEHRPDTKRPLSGWLATVVRNLALQRRRGEVRRETREAGAARDEAAPSTLDVVEKVSAHREVVEAVLGLDEPYRTTILLRFFENLAPSAIARECRVPVATVKARLARGLERLRAKLDRDHGGDGTSWLLALTPLVRNPGGPIAATVGTLLVSTNLKIAIAAVAVVCGASFLWISNRASDADTATRAADSSSASAAAEAAPVERLSTGTPASSREAEQPRPSAAPPAIAATTAEPLALVRGRVLDLQARPLSAVRVWFQAGPGASSKEFSVRVEPPAPDAPSTQSEANGRFELVAPTTPGRILSADPKLATVLAGLCGPASTKSEVILIVAPRLELAGRVVAEDGRPLVDVRVAFALPEHFRKKFPEVLDSSEEQGWFTHTDARGLFELADVPQIDGARIQAHLEGWLGYQEPAPQASARGIEIVLRRPHAAPGSVSGQVVDDRGALAAEARVSLGTSSATSDEQGAFTLSVPEGGTKAPWMAVKRGYLPAIEIASPALQAGQADGSEFVVLKLGPPPRAIEGRVVDGHGEPLGDVKVWTVDPTFFGKIDDTPTQVEGILSGAATRSDIEKILTRLGPAADAQSVLSETATVFWPFVKTDDAGRFRIEGLLDREYRIAAMDNETLLRVESDPVLAGNRDVEIRLDTAALYERVAGRVVSASGAPVQGVAISAMCDVMTIHESENATSVFHRQGKRTTTDAEGRFVFTKVPKERVYLRLDGEDILPLEYGRGDARGIAGPTHGEVEKIELRVELRYHMQVEMPANEAASADSIRILDGKGQPVAINVFMGNSRYSSDTVQLKDGKSDALVVAEDAQTLVLVAKGVEVKRVALHLVPHELNLVKP
jgi:RNA polymerase sigma-70 factor (ECF subfamily)